IGGGGKPRRSVAALARPHPSRVAAAAAVALRAPGGCPSGSRRLAPRSARTGGHSQHYRDSPPQCPRAVVDGPEPGVSPGVLGRLRIGLPSCSPTGPVPSPGTTLWGGARLGWVDGG